MSGDAWVSGNARVYGSAWVYHNALVYGDARVSGNALVYGDAWVSGNARVYGNAWVSGNARVSGDALLSDKDKYVYVGPIGSRKAYTTFMLDKNKKIIVSCGCFDGGIKEFEKRVTETHKNNRYAKQYLCAIKLAKELLL